MDLTKIATNFMFKGTSVHSSPGDHPRRGVFRRLEDSRPLTPKELPSFRCQQSYRVRTSLPAWQGNSQFLGVKQGSRRAQLARYAGGSRQVIRGGRPRGESSQRWEASGISSRRSSPLSPHSPEAPLS